MNQLFIFLFLLSTSVSFSQETIQKIELFENTNSKITSISYSVDTVEELQKIDWKGVKQIFSTNKDDQEISMSFEINLKKSKNNLKAKFSVNGVSQKIDSLIINSKKGINGLIKLANKYSNQ